MDISRETDYALRMVAALINHPGDNPSVRSVAEEFGIPYSFAQSIQHSLTEAGVIVSTRGAHGGMYLAIDPDQVTLLDFVQMLQGPVLLSACETCGENGEDCPGKPYCTYDPIWMFAQDNLRKYPSSFTLREAANGIGLARLRKLSNKESGVLDFKKEDTPEDDSDDEVAGCIHIL